MSSYRREKYKEYENLATRILKSPNLSFQLDDGTTVNFSNSKRSTKKVKGCGKKDHIEHQIDIQLYSSKHKAVLYGECKFHKSYIEKTEVSAFIKIIENIREYEDMHSKRKLVPIFITSSDFQPAALQMLEYYNICYLKITPTCSHHFIGKQIKIESYKIGKKRIAYSNTNKFYYSRHGTSSNLDMCVNDFLFYKNKETNDFFDQTSCAKNKEYTITASTPLATINPIKNSEVKTDKIVSEITFKYFCTKSYKFKEENPIISLLHDGTYRAVYKDLRIITVKLN